MENDASGNDKTLLQIIVWSSSLAVAASLGLLFGFHGTDGTAGYELGMGSLLAFAGGLAGTWLFWKKVFNLQHDPRRMWRFILVSCVLLVIAFIGCVFLPQFSPTGPNKGDLLQGMILGFAAVAGVLFLARTLLRIFEKADANANADRQRDFQKM